MRNLVIVSILVLAISCEKYVEDVNINPNAFTDAPGELVIGQAALESVNLLAGANARLAGIFTDQFTGADRQYIPFDSYVVTSPDFNSSWSNIYSSGYAQAKFSRDKAIESQNPILEGVAEILMALFIGEASALYGDVPFTEAGDPDNFPNPNYDSQTAILEQVQELLSNAITKVGDSRVRDFYGELIFQPNEASWSELAHTLKARYYLMAKDYNNAYMETFMGVNSAAGDLLSQHTTAVGSQNLYFQFGSQLREDYLTVTNSYLRRLMEGTEPRLLDTPGDIQRATVYFNGIQLNYTDEGYFGQEAPSHLITYVENKLIQAESAERIGEDGLTPFNEIRAFLSNKFQGDFPASTSSGDALILEILEEKYVSLIGQLSVFSDVRRTGNAIGVPIKSSTAPGIPQRFLYPNQESQSNVNFPGLKGLFEPTAVNQ